MKMAIVQCPAWSVDRPPYALALIVSLLRDSPYGHEAIPFDLNVEMYRRAEAEGREFQFTLAGKPEKKFGPESWSGWAVEFDWAVQEHVQEFVRANQDYVDGRIDAILATGAPVVGFSVQYTAKFFSVEFARRLKERDPSKIVIFGGPHCFPNFQDNLLHHYDFIDVVCRGECEGSLPELLHDIELNGLDSLDTYRKYQGYEIRPRLSASETARLASPWDALGKPLTVIDDERSSLPPQIDMEDLPVADWSWVDFSNYTTKAIPVITSRGCVRRCRFCGEAGAATTSWGAFRCRDAKTIMAEIRYQYDLYEFDYIWFADSVFNGNMAMVNELCDLMIEADLDFQWQAQLTIRKEMTDEIFEKFKRSGCHMLHWGLETGSDAVLRLMRKGYTREMAEVVLKRAHRAGLKHNVNLIVGYPGETEEHFQESMDFIGQLAPYGIVNPPVAPCSVVRGAKLFDMVDELDIELAPDDQWFIRDGSNTYEIRLDRKQRMETFLDQVIGQGSEYQPLLVPSRGGEG